ASNRPSAPAHARVAADFPATTDSSSSGASDSAGSASTTVEKNGPGYTARPSSSITTISSRKLIPAPPPSSGSEIPVQPSSATSDQDDGSNPSPSAISATRSTGYFDCRNSRAESRSISCSSLKVKFIGSWGVPALV